MDIKLYGKLKKKYSFLSGASIECGNGWYTLLDVLCDEIQRELEACKRDGVRTDFEAVQIKEKYGGLRFYTGGENMVIYGLICFAESMSRHICENCGNHGVLRDGPWVRTLCDKHASIQEE